MFLFISFLMIMMSAEACNQSNPTAPSNDKNAHVEYDQEALEKLETAYFASGCFWCVEAIFESVEGVGEVISGYSGGSAKDANYKDVSAGITDHAEAVEVYYDPSVVTYKTLLKVFFGSHDPTTLNRQGPDAGRQYRSEIYYKNEAEKTTTDQFIQQLYEDGTFDKGTITTLITPLDKFYPAEDYHQNYERLNPNQGYVRAVSVPRLKKFQAKFPDLLKKSNH
jgi:peptide-methionine (S)-S-oxide reductase